VVVAGVAAAAAAVVVVGGVMRELPPSTIAGSWTLSTSIHHHPVGGSLSSLWLLSQPSFRFDFLAQTDRSLVYRFSHLFNIYSRFLLSTISFL
jgi:hypothetical protein